MRRLIYWEEGIRAWISEERGSAFLRSPHLDMYKTRLDELVLDNCYIQEIPWKMQSKE